MSILPDSRFTGIEPFKQKIWLSSPTMHGDELKWITDAFDKNWITTAGENVNECEKLVKVNADVIRLRENAVRLYL